MIDDVAPKLVWEALMSNPDAVLCDVRTTAEWHFVGMPDLSQTGKPIIPVQWQVFPTMQPNPEFLDQLKEAGVEVTHHIYFLCRTGGRSLAAAHAARDAGYRHVYNIKDGFEGPHDQRGHRGNVAGWKHQGLPWSHR
ncbi:rhodanese-like domain-containing protein [Acidiphilium sp.]|uniref:rhodanese-like domain-containing protein n=1 Tax=Acidiphilium sp. TaxID=527 RepID=UPI003D083930